MSGKNLRALGREESPNRQQTLHEIIRELQEEIARGEPVYTPAELARLESRLLASEEMLRRLLGP